MVFRLIEVIMTLPFDLCKDVLSFMVFFCVMCWNCFIVALVSTGTPDRVLSWLPLLSLMLDTNVQTILPLSVLFFFKY